MRVLIEIPKGSKVKYELDKDLNLMVADRIVPFPYPDNYGYVPNTLADDGDPLDVFVLSEHAIAPGTLVDVIIIGMIEMQDAEEIDNKLLAVMFNEDELPHQKLRIQAIRDFLTIYKEDVKLGKTVEFEEAEGYLAKCKGAHLVNIWSPNEEEK